MLLERGELKIRSLVGESLQNFLRLFSFVVVLGVLFILATLLIVLLNLNYPEGRLQFNLPEIHQES